VYKAVAELLSLLSLLLLRLRGVGGVAQVSKLLQLMHQGLSLHVHLVHDHLALSPYQLQGGI
jgi:hypothetical protein